MIEGEFTAGRFPKLTESAERAHSVAASNDEVLGLTPARLVGSSVVKKKPHSLLDILQYCF